MTNEKKIARLLKALDECIACLEHGCPPRGGYTDKTIRRAKAAVKAVTKPCEK